MIEESILRFNIDANESYMIGDTMVDIQTGKNAELETILVLSGEGGRDKKYDEKPDYVCRNLREAVNIIVNVKEK
jgi:phosphoglycolate phosphatase-like HAD superfamily hydrolase